MTKSNTTTQRRIYLINGIVQGVGFRPFVYGLACDLKLSGYVRNDADGVTIAVQGESGQLNQFAKALCEQAPALSRIDQFIEQNANIDQDPDFDGAFQIKNSEKQHSARVAIFPDQAMCKACQQDINTPTDRHYRYPFTNCTHCGPRYTIINRLPYDRASTAMASFTMCPACAKSYQDPRDRRYHAQPVSCPACGPTLRWRSPSGQLLSQGDDALEACAIALKQGALVAVKGLGGFHLMTDAHSSTSVQRLRQLKRRQRKPLAVMMPNLEWAKQYGQGHTMEWELLQSPARPITLLTKHCVTQMAAPYLPLAPEVAPGIAYLGMMLPYTPLHDLLLEHCQKVLCATSANDRGAPIITQLDEIIAVLGQHIDGILEHDRPILHPCDDSLVQVCGQQRQILRFSRGYAPRMVPLNTPCQGMIAALGAEQKNQLALAWPGQWLDSPYIGNLHSVTMLEHLEQTLATFSQLYERTPTLLVSDLHPHYLSQQWAADYCQHQQIPYLQVQHHYAHLLAVMAEHQRTEPVFGLAFDGTGFGEDGTLWGGECLLARMDGFERLAHLTPFRLIGAEQAIRQPVRQLLALLWQMDSKQALPAIAPIQALTQAQLHNLQQLWQRGQNAPITSSMGRLFDAVAVLLGLIDNPDYEGEAGLLIESTALELGEESPWPLHFELIAQKNGPWLIDWQALLKELLAQRTRVKVARLAAGFLQAISQLALTLAKQLNPQAYPVVLGGGVFQNRALMDQLMPALSQAGYLPLSNQTLPVNDGGISAGQLWYALHHPLAQTTTVNLEH